MSTHMHYEDMGSFLRVSVGKVAVCGQVFGFHIPKLRAHLSNRLSLGIDIAEVKYRIGTISTFSGLGYVFRSNLACL